MAYVTGTANSFADLLTAIRNACTANGWTLAGNVLHKGGCYASLVLGVLPGTGNPRPPADSHLALQCGTGIDGGNLLVNPSPVATYIGQLRTAVSGTWTDVAFPITYHVHLHGSPDEVWVFFNYNSEFWQWLGFGRSPTPGNASGVWHASTIAPAVNLNTGALGNDAQTHKSNVHSGARGVSNRGPANGSTVCSQPFMLGAAYESTYITANGFMHGGIDDSTGVARWSSRLPAARHFNNGAAPSYPYRAHGVCAWHSVEPLYGLMPSVWSNEAILLHIHVTQQRLESKTSLISELGHVRLTRNNFIAPGEIVPLGPDRWKVYPAYRRNVGVTGDIVSDGEAIGADHSGTFAIAVRYDGP